MITSAESDSLPEDRDRLLVVGGAEMARVCDDAFRRDYPMLSVCHCDTYLSGIAEASKAPVRAVLAHVNPMLVHLDEAVIGLREAIGPKAKLILCCVPAHEPAARRIVRGVADEYVLLPLQRPELDRAIGYARPSAFPSADGPAYATMDELEGLGELISTINAHPSELLEHLAGLVRAAVNAQGVTVIVEGAVATSGDVVVHPVLASPLTGEKGVIGQVTLGPRVEGAYSPTDAEKLRHYASVAGRVLAAASSHRQLRRLAVTDECSGLPNRRYLFAQLDRILERARQERFTVTVLIFDIDNFKDYNDRLGHDAGDRIIRTVGGVFRRLCREQDVVARIGGDEFAVVFWDPEGPRSPGSEHPDSALTVLDRVREALRRTPIDSPDGARDASTQTGPMLPANTGELSLTISGGLATFPWDATTREDVLRRADEALLSAKRAGKNRIFLIGQPGSR